MFENIKAKSIINKKGFGDLLKTNYCNYDTMILKYIKPDVVIKGGDYKGKHIPEMDTEKVVIDAEYVKEKFQETVHAEDLDRYIL